MDRIFYTKRTIGEETNPMHAPQPGFEPRTIALGPRCTSVVLLGHYMSI